MLKKVLSAVAVLAAGAMLMADLARAQTRERSGEEVVKSQCIKCHGSGADGAPRIDDRAAWAPRLKQGLDATVRSAIRGHGKMPARGGIADVTDTELRAAILYMFYPAGASLKPRDAAQAQRDANHRRVGGLDIYMGVAPAASAPAAAKGPRGKGQYYVTFSLHDAGSNAFVKDAQVEVRAANAVTGGETKKLEPVTLNDAPSYGNFFRMEGKEPYAITVRVRRSGEDGRLETSFTFRP
jgi:cytochrome c5